MQNEMAIFFPVRLLLSATFSIATFTFLAVVAVVGVVVVTAIVAVVVVVVVAAAV